MTDAAIALNVYQALNVKSDVTTKIAFHEAVLVDVITKLADIVLGEVADADVGIDAGSLDDIISSLTADTIDVGQTDLNSLISGQVNTGYTSHIV